MHALYLPGNSPENRSVTYELAGRINGLESSTVLEYPHWTSDDPADVVADLDEVSDDLIGSFADREKDFVVIAKSIGVNLCLRAQTISEFFSPRQVIFIGSAINETARESGVVDRWLNGYRTPSMWLQNEKDPALPAEELRQYLESLGIADMDFVSLNGDTHEYEPEALAGIINQRLDLS